MNTFRRMEVVTAIRNIAREVTIPLTTSVTLMMEWDEYTFAHA